MSAATTTSLLTLLDGYGFDTRRLDRASNEIEMVIDTFDVWQNSNSSADLPVMGCVCFRDPETEEAVAA